MIQDSDLDVVENNTSILRVNGRFITELGFDVIIPSPASYDDPSFDVYIRCSEDFISKNSKTINNINGRIEMTIQKDKYTLFCIAVSKSRVSESFILRVDRVREV